MPRERYTPPFPPTLSQAFNDLDDNLKKAAEGIADKLRRARESLLHDAFEKGIHPAWVRVIVDLDQDGPPYVAQLSLDTSTARIMTPGEKAEIAALLARRGQSSGTT
jgi:hypothetical protein